MAAYSELSLFLVRVSGKHEVLQNQYFYGVGYIIDDVMMMVDKAASVNGWSDIDYDEINKLGKLSFCPFMDESEYEECKLQK